MLKTLVLASVFALVSCAVSGGTADKLPEDVWVQLAAGQAQDLIVELDTKADKQSVLAALPVGSVEVLNAYEALPMLFIRFRSTAALKALLENPAVLNVFPNQQERLMPKK